jgi:hypothetical protein
MDDMFMPIELLWYTLILNTLALQLCLIDSSQSASYSFGYLLFYLPTMLNSFAHTKSHM